MKAAAHLERRENTHAVGSEQVARVGVSAGRWRAGVLCRHARLLSNCGSTRLGGTCTVGGTCEPESWCVQEMWE